MFKVAIALVAVYAAGAISYIVGIAVAASVPGSIGGFSVSGLLVLVFLVLAVGVIILGTLTIVVKVLTDSVTDSIMRRMSSEGMK